MPAGIPMSRRLWRNRQRDHKFHAIEHFDAWSIAVEMQGVNLLEISERLHHLKLSRPVVSTSATVHGGREQRAAANVYILSLHQLRTAAGFVAQTWAEPARQVVEDAIRGMDNSIQALRQIRNAVTHFEDYAKGSGSLQRGMLLPTLEYVFATTSRDPARFDVEIEVFIGGVDDEDSELFLSVADSLDAAMLAARKIAQATFVFPG